MGCSLEDLMELWWGRCEELAGAITEKFKDVDAKEFFNAQAEETRSEEAQRDRGKTVSVGTGSARLMQSLSPKLTANFVKPPAICRLGTLRGELLRRVHLALFFTTWEGNRGVRCGGVSA